MYKIEDINKAKQYLSEQGYGTGSNFTLNTVSNLMAEWAAKNCTIPTVGDSKIQKVKATKDESGHWYVIPIEIMNEFEKDEQDEDFVDSGKFDDKYRRYRTGGGLNLVQLYAVI
jgi:hypothetical protein